MLTGNSSETQRSRLTKPAKIESDRIAELAIEQRDFFRAEAPGRSRVALFASIAVLLVAATLATAAEPKRVMLLHSFGRDFKPWSEYSKSIHAELERQSPWPLDITDHTLVTARSSDESSEGAFVEYLRALYGKNRPDLIVSIGAPAAAFVQRHRQQFFANTPMVFTAVDQRRVQYSTLTEHDAVVAVRINYLAAVENILRVLPETKNVTVVIGTSPIERFWREEIGREVKPLEGRLSFTWTDDLSFEDILKRAAALPPRSAIFWELMSVDAAGVVYEGDTALTRLHAVANAPIFSYDDSFFGRELVGGPMLSVLEGSRQTATVGIRILGGEKPSEIAVSPVQFATPKFDWREMKRWGISESNLPPGSEIQFREPTAWERYRWQISLISAVVFLQALLIVGLVHQRRRRYNAEAESLQRMSELAHLDRYATAGEMSASIAHEINQPIGALVLNTEATMDLLRTPSPNLQSAQDILAAILRDGHRASEVIRRLRNLLTKKDFQVEDIDLNETVREVVGFLSTQANARKIVLISDFAPIAPRISGDQVQLQQVILNLVVNSMDAISSADSGERKIIIRTSQNDGFAEISVSDSGPGISPDKLSEVFKPFFTTKQNGMGMGLSIATTIVKAHHGRLWAANQPQGGAAVFISLPLAP